MASSHRSSVALHLVTMPGCTRGKVHLQNAATMKRTKVPQQHAQTPTEETKACHKSQCEHASRGVPGNTKPTEQQARATQGTGRKCSAFLPGAEAAVNARNRVQQVHVRDVTAITLQVKPVGRHLPKHAENASRGPRDCVFIYLPDKGCRPGALGAQMRAQVLGKMRETCVADS